MRLAAIIRKTGRSPTAPLVQAHAHNLAQNSIQIRRRVATVPLALIHPRKQRRETNFAARILKTGRCPTAPLVPLLIRMMHRIAMLPLA
jgi:hypothetical protein